MRFEIEVDVVALEHGTAGWRVHTHGPSRPRESWQARSLVNCASAWGGRIAALHGDAVPLSAESLMMMVTERVAPFLAPTVGCVGRALSCKQLKNGTVLIGGGHRGTIEADGSTRARLPAIMTSARTAATIFPCLRAARVVRTWTAIEGFFPDDIPVIGRPGTAPDAYHAFGFCGHGFELGPLVGRLIAELMLDGTASLPIEPFDVGRFAAAVRKTGSGSTAIRALEG